MYMSFFVKYLSGKTFGDKKVKPETSADLEVGLRGLYSLLWLDFFNLDLCIFVGPFTRTKSK